VCSARVIAFEGGDSPGSKPNIARPSVRSLTTLGTGHALPELKKRTAGVRRPWGVCSPAAARAVLVAPSLARGAARPGPASISSRACGGDGPSWLRTGAASCAPSARKADASLHAVGRSSSPSIVAHERRAKTDRPFACLLDRSCSRKPVWFVARVREVVEHLVDRARNRRLTMGHDRHSPILMCRYVRLHTFRMSMLNDAMAALTNRPRSSYGHRAEDTGTATWSGSVASQITTYAGRARKAHPASTPARRSGSCGASSAPGGSEATPLGSCLAFATSICAATSPDAETRRKDAPLGFFDDLVLDTDQCYLFTLEPGVPDLDVTRLPKPLANLFRRHAHT